MDTRIPVRLRKEPLLEAIWEIRFSGAAGSIADLLPGILFKTFPNRYKTTVRLVAADIPVPILENDPNFRYAPKIRLEGDNQGIQIGDRVVSLNCRRPYTGWAKFSDDIRELAKTVAETGLVERLERFSLKYIDLIELEKSVGLGHLNLQLKLGKYEITTKPVQLRTEIKHDEFVHIVQIISPAEVGLPSASERLKGVLLDIDSISPMGADESWETLHERLDELHLACKKMFFSMLRPETIKDLDPEYDG